ncbi:Protein RER1 like protein [Cucumispora dikerogammari]|nr:Protein RER1 like protein [Cucumispora dikerogammari]
MEAQYNIYLQKLQHKYRSLIPKIYLRWSIFLFLVFSFLFKVLIITQSHYLVSYTIGVFIIHEFVKFCIPADENIPDPFDDFHNSDITLILDEDNDDSKPFYRKLSEFHFWQNSTFILCIGILCSFFEVFDIPVYGIVLALYFITVVIITIKNLYFHSKKFKYNPFDFISKKKFDF